MKLNEKLVIVKQLNRTFVFFANDDTDIQLRWEEYCYMYGVDPKTPTDPIVDQFVKWLVQVYGYARQDDGMDYELLELPSYSTD